MIEAARRPERMGVTVRPATLKDVRAISRIAGNARRRFMPAFFDGGKELNKKWIDENKINGPRQVRERIRAMREDPTQNLASVAMKGLLAIFLVMLKAKIEKVGLIPFVSRILL